MKKFVNAWNYVPGTNSSEKVSKLPSCTVPGEAISVIELLRRFQSGQPLPSGSERLGGYDSEASHDSPDIEKIAGMDLADPQELAEQIAAELKKAESLGKKRQQDAEAKRIDDEVSKRVAEKEAAKEAEKALKRPIKKPVEDAGAH